ncbi:MAG: hypothetical protein WC454_09200 [Phycisphaerae bacterium]|jgi:hypothetical protein
MVKAILAGSKTQTRRVVKDVPDWVTEIGWDCFSQTKGLDWVAGRGIYKDKGPAEKFIRCPYGQIGDRLWCKETHYRFGHWVKNGLTKTGRQKWLFKPNDKEVRYMDNPPTENVHRIGEKNAVGWFKRSSLFMPRWASRITLEITNIRVELLQDITETGAISEGCCNAYHPDFHVGEFRDLWDSINSKTYPWESNPWVWVIEFKRNELKP